MFYIQVLTTVPLFQSPTPSFMVNLQVSNLINFSRNLNPLKSFVQCFVITDVYGFLR